MMRIHIGVVENDVIIKSTPDGEHAVCRLRKILQPGYPCVASDLNDRAHYQAPASINRWVNFCAISFVVPAKVK